MPYLLAHKPDIPLVGSQFTLALVEAKLRRAAHRALHADRAARADASGSGRSSASSSRSTTPSRTRSRWRSAPRAGLVLHTGDFKMDQLPLDGRLTDLAGFARLGAEGVDLLLSDSTNAEMPGFVTPGAGDRAGARLDLREGEAAGSSSPPSPRTCTGCSRCSTSAAAHGRKVAFIGRSMVRNMGIARDLGLLHIPAGLMVELDEVDRAAAGAGRADVHRFAGRADERAGPDGQPATTGTSRIEPGDTVVLASSLVPGNETAVYRVINGLARAGALVVHKDVAKVHVSGHAPAGELLYLLNVVRPRNFMPVHGEWRHLRAHARLGRADRRARGPGRARRGRRRRRPGRRRGASVAARSTCRYVYVDGLAVGDVGESPLKERRILGDGGFIAATVVVDSVTGKVAGGPTVSAHGLLRRPGGVRPGDPAGQRPAGAGAPRASPTRTSCRRSSAARRPLGQRPTAAGR